jgi:hypothetical protein
MEDVMASLDSENIDAPHQTRPFREHGHMDVVTVGDFTLGNGTFEPGWRWSADVKPIAGPDACRIRHTGICVTGRMGVRMDHGTQCRIGPGDVVLIEPGYDAWVIGDEACVMDDTGMTDAEPSS